MGNVYYTGKLKPKKGDNVGFMDSTAADNLETTESDMFNFTDIYGYRVYTGDITISQKEI